MPATPELASTAPELPWAHRTAQVVLPRTRTGQIKHRFTWDEKLRILDPTAPTKTTAARLEAFRNLFAFRRTDAIITKVGQGPRAWTALRGPLTLPHIARHLLADTVPTLKPQWVGARILKGTFFLCIDVDPDRTAHHTLADKYDLTRLDDDEVARLLRQTKPANPKPKPPFTDRCRQVEATFRRLGVNPADPTQTLVVPTPSGGRHYYLFLDGRYFPDQIQALFEAAGLHHRPGETEFFPSTRQGLRLPFGHIPGQPHDRTAWIRFIDA
jgi:hypothetical protein